MSLNIWHQISQLSHSDKFYLSVFMLRQCACKHVHHLISNSFNILIVCKNISALSFGMVLWFWCSSPHSTKLQLYRDGELCPTGMRPRPRDWQMSTYITCTFSWRYIKVNKYWHIEQRTLNTLYPSNGWNWLVFWDYIFLNLKFSGDFFIDLYLGTFSFGLCIICHFSNYAIWLFGIFRLFS